MNRQEFRKVEKALYSYNLIKMAIKGQLEEMERIEKEYEGCSAIGYEERTGLTYRITSSVENEVLNKERNLKRLEKNIIANQKIISMIDNGMELLSSDEKKLVELKYFTREKLGWEQIGMRLGFSGDYCRTKLRDKIIDHMHYMLFENPYKQYSFDDFN